MSTTYNVTVDDSSDFDVTVEDGINVNVTLNAVLISLSDLPDVTLTSATNQQVLKYDSSDGVWKNEGSNIINLQSGQDFTIKDQFGFPVFTVKSNGDIEIYGEMIKK